MVARISVVMCCYRGDRLAALREATESVFNQTVTFHEFLIVVDGPVNVEIASYLDGLTHIDSRVSIIRLIENQGAAKARNHGMSLATGDYIAIMDADDILYPERFELQLDAISKHKVDAVWGWQEEFYDGSGDYGGIKRCAEHHDEIVRELKFRCLLPDPTTLIRRECFEKTGGYLTFLELGIDHGFFIAMALAGFRFYCIQRPLIRVRISMEQRHRRGGIRVFRGDIALRRWMRSVGFIGQAEYLTSLMIFGAFRLSPSFVRDISYRGILRKNKSHFLNRLFNVGR